MRRLFYLLLILFVCACSPTARRNKAKLIEAERLMREHPDSSLALLLSVDTSALHGDDVHSALYGLLLTQARFKNSIPPDDDSLIAASRRFYEWSDDKYHCMLANYYYGRMRLNANDYSKSLFSFFNSYEQALALDDKFWIAMNAERICEIFTETFNWKEMAKYAKIEYDNFKESGTPLYIHDAIWDMAMAYHCNQEYDSSIVLCKQLVDTAHKYRDNDLLEDALRQIALSNFGAEKYDIAAECFKKLCDSPMAKTTDSAYYSLSMQRQGYALTAKEYIPNLATYNNVDLLAKYNIYLSLGIIDSAFNVLQKLNSNKEIFINRHITNNLTGALIDLHNYRLKLEHEHQRSTKIKLWSIIIISIMLTSIIACTTWEYIRRQRRVVDKNVSIAQNLRDIMNVRDSEHEFAVLDLLGDRFDLLDELCRVMYENGNSAQSRKKISKEIDKLIEQYSEDENKIAELELYADSHYNNIMSKFKKDFPNLIPNDYLIFLYSIYGFSSSAIALFLKLDSVSKVYDRRKRLKNKIKAYEGENRAMYLRIFAKNIVNK